MQGVRKIRLKKKKKIPFSYSTFNTLCAEVNSVEASELILSKV